MLWNPWRGCHKVSEGCKNCYIHKGDAKRGQDTNQIVKTKDFNKPLEKDKTGNYKIKSGTLVYVCFSSDFLIEEADTWRLECLEMMRIRSDLHFLFLTKRIDRFFKVITKDHLDIFDHITVGVSVENQKQADMRLSILKTLPIKHKNIICQPMIGPIDLSAYLDHIELVVVGGESDHKARFLDYDWVLSIRALCIKQNVSFQFRQCSTYFKKADKMYHIPTKQLSMQAKKAAINFMAH